MKNSQEINSVTWNPHLLDQFEQYEIFSKAALSLYLVAPDDDATVEENNILRDEQREQIMNFVNLLHDAAISREGKLLLCLYHCECNRVVKITGSNADSIDFNCLASR